MTESEKHKQLKLLGRTILKTKGFENSQIKEEYKVKIGNKNFVVDVCGVIDGPYVKKESIAVECGTTNPEKLINLKLLFDEVIHLPYGITSLETDLRELLDEQQTEINLLKKENKKLTLKVNNQSGTLDRYSHDDNIRIKRDLVIEVLHRMSRNYYYPYSKDDKLIEEMLLMLKIER